MSINAKYNTNSNISLLQLAEVIPVQLTKVFRKEGMIRLLWTTLFTSSCLEKRAIRLISSVFLYTNLVDHKYLSHDMTKPTKWVCAQRRLRSAWASAQSDQSLRCVLQVRVQKWVRTPCLDKLFKNHAICFTGNGFTPITFALKYFGIRNAPY